MLRLFIILSIIFIIAGMLWPFFSQAGMGRLPGDFIIRTKGFVVYLPVLTAVISAAVVAAILRLVGKV